MVVFLGSVIPEAMFVAGALVKEDVGPAIGAAKRIIEISKKQNTRKPKIGVVVGDDLLEYMSDEEILDSPTMEGLDFSNNNITAANVYLGAQPIADALAKDVDIVIVGRTVDSALALGPLIYEYGWKQNDLDLLGSLSFDTNLFQKQYETNKYEQSLNNKITYSFKSACSNK